MMNKTEDYQIIPIGQYLYRIMKLEKHRGYVWDLIKNKVTYNRKEAKKTIIIRDLMTLIISLLNITVWLVYTPIYILIQTVVILYTGIISILFFSALVIKNLFNLLILPIYTNRICNKLEKLLKDVDEHDKVIRNDKD